MSEVLDFSGAIDPLGYRSNNASNIYEQLNGDDIISWLKRFQQDQYSYNAAQTIDQRKWLQMMDNTKYQRMVDDMKKAGINPVVAFQNGVSAPSIPSTSAASGSQTSISSLVAAIAAILTTNTKAAAQITSSIIKVFS